MSAAPANGKSLRRSRIDLPGRRYGKTLLRILVSLALLTFLLSRVDYRSVLDSIAGTSYALLIVVLLIHVADRWLMAWKWRLLVTAGGANISLLEAFKIYWVTSFQGVIVPLGFAPDILRFYSLKRRGVASENAAASIVVERLVGFVATGLVALLSLALFVELTTSVPSYWIGVALAVIAIPVLAAFRMHSKGQSVLKLGGSRIAKLESRLQRSGYYRAVVAFRHHGAVLRRFLTWSMLEQLAPVSAVFVTAIALGLPISFIVCLAVVPIGSLLERLPIAFMGVGIREGSFAVLLPLFGIPYSQAILLSALEFGLFLISLTPAAIWMLAGPQTESRVSLRPRTEEAGGDSTSEL
jgi:uncharacterized protein (TIRG00374 family)